MYFWNLSSSLVGTLVGKSGTNYDTQDSDCKKENNLLQRGPFTLKWTIPRGHLLCLAVYFVTGQCVTGNINLATRFNIPL